MHPAHSHLLAQQVQTDSLRRAMVERSNRRHRDALAPRPTMRTRLGDALVATGHRLTDLGDRIVATASPPTTATSRLDGGQEGACAGC
jgi:hypothetical protein